LSIQSELALNARAWPFEQARLLLKRLEKQPPRDGVVTFETGYGPSGLPHLGTFGEVARTTMVRHAFETLTKGAFRTRLIAFSDDMDGMRKVPTNLPNQDMLTEHLGKPLTEVPDPFGQFEGFAQHNNAMLCRFLDSFGFDYTFYSATEMYRSGAFDAALLNALDKFEAIMDVMLPTLGPERRATYSPFLPISPKTGRVLYVPMKSIDKAAGTITFLDEDGEEMTMRVTGGNTKLQWKPDFGMRWAALGVDYEMFGKDHQANSIVYSRICQILGFEPPVQFVYELFLDEKGEKISKSKGNGISIDAWLTYANQESLALFNFIKPRVARKLYFDVIPKTTDDYLAYLAAFEGQSEAERLENPVWHIHAGAPSDKAPPVSFSLLLNLVSAASTDQPDVLWGFVERYVPGASSATEPLLYKLTHYAIRYYRDFVEPSKIFRAPSDHERAAMADLVRRLRGYHGDAKDGEALQTLVFTVAKDHGFEPLRNWFTALYEVVMGQSQGPRFGSFIAIYGPEETADLIEAALAR
jgi:lysyl-tRNA synthetase, class I